MEAHDTHRSILVGVALTSALMALLTYFMWFPDAHDDAPSPEEETTTYGIEEAPPESPRLDRGGFENFADIYAQHYKANPRHLIHVTLDRPMYRPGQEIRWKSWHLSAGAFDRRDGSDRQVDVELENARGDVVEEATVELEHGLADGGFSLDEEAAGGNWTLRVIDGDEEFERPVLVSAFEPSRFRKVIEFSQTAYRPGETIEVEAEILRDTGEAPAGLEIGGYADVDGEHIADLTGSLDGDGRIDFSIELPDRIHSKNANLVISVEDGGIVETEVRPIPLALDDVVMEFQPEGGELVEDLTSRVYFEATDLSGAPVEVRGEVVDSDGRVIADLETAGDGRGRFELTPEPYQTYGVKLSEPDVDIDQQLPTVQSEGCVLRVYDDLESTLDEIRAGIWCDDDREVAVMGAMGDELFDIAVVEAGPDEPGVAYLAPEDEWPRPAGIARITVADKEHTERRRTEVTTMQPLAERVLFRNRTAQMHIELRTDDEVYHPGETVELEVVTTGPDGEPLRAELVKAVVDDRVHARATDQAPSILGRILLEADDLHFWGDVERADRYFDVDDEEAALALDLLMGTRGWRTDEERRDFLVDGGDNELKLELRRDRQRRRTGSRSGDQEELSGQPRAVEGSVIGTLDDEGAMDAIIDDAVADIDMDAIMDDRDVAMEGQALGRSAGQDRGGFGGADALRSEPSPSPPGEVAPMDSAEAGVDAPGAKRPRWLRDDDAGAYAAWEASMMTDQSGTVERNFDLPEAIGAYRITVEGVSHEGYLGHAETVVPVELPMSVALRMPEILSGGDQIELPVTVRNGNATPLSADVELATRGAVAIDGEASFQVDVPADGTTTEYVTISVGDDRGEGAIEVFAEGDGFADGAERIFEIEPAGYRQTWHESGNLPGENTHEVPLAGMTDIGAVGDLVLYPNPVSEAMEGVDSMTRRPTGCFEQTSSINHPNVLVWRYLDAMEQLDGDLEKSLRDHIDYGFERMVGFEVDGGGFDWFGRAPANAPLTAWGLAQFSQMEDIVVDFDQDVIDRSANWLRKLADDDGGWRDQRAWSRTRGDQRKTAELFVLYGLARADALDGFDAQLQAAKETVQQSDRLYDVALASAVVAIDGSDAQAVNAAIDRLVEMQNDDGSWTPEEGRSWARSFGSSLNVETTALAIQALLAANGPASDITRAVDWLGGQKTRTGWWGSTQATVMALEARISYEEEYLGDDEGPVRVVIGGEVVGEDTMTTDDLEPLRIEGVGAYLTDNDPSLTIESDVPADYDLELSWRVEEFDVDAKPPLALSVDVEGGDPVTMGDEVSVVVELENRESDRLGMSVAHVALPAGVEVTPRQLDSLVERTDVDFYETTGREVILYFDDFDGQERQKLRFSGTAAVPGSFEHPASVAYPYYRNENYWQWAHRSVFEIDTP